MLTTEAKAQENWCPMVRIARRETFEVRRPAVGGMEVVHTEQFIPGGCNTDALGRNRVPASCRCIGSGCMMWRWDTDHTQNLRRKFTPASDTQATAEPSRRESGIPVTWTWSPYDDSDGEPAGWLEPEDEMLARRLGYCGLAGMPLAMAKTVAEAGR